MKGGGVGRGSDEEVSESTLSVGTSVDVNDARRVIEAGTGRNSEERSNFRSLIKRLT